MEAQNSHHQHNLDNQNKNLYKMPGQDQVRRHILVYTGVRACVRAHSCLLLNKLITVNFYILQHHIICLLFVALFSDLSVMLIDKRKMQFHNASKSIEGLKMIDWDGKNSSGF